MFIFQSSAFNLAHQWHCLNLLTKQSRNFYVMSLLWIYRHFYEYTRIGTLKPFSWTISSATQAHHEFEVHIWDANPLERIQPFQQLSGGQQLELLSDSCCEWWPYFLQTHARNLRLLNPLHLELRFLLAGGELREIHLWQRAVPSQK